jgi:Flp pilus assembly protein TadD
MPRLAARDGGHTAFTDHRIARQPQAQGLKSEQDGLKAWREPESRLRDRNLAIALVTVGLQDAHSAEVIRGYKMLNQVVKAYPDDPASLTSLGTVLLRARQPAEALLLFDKVIRLKPDYAPYRMNAAVALMELSRKGEAERRLDQALELDPLLEPAVQLRNRLHKERGDSLP